MITTPKEYNEKLWQIQSENAPTLAILLPSTEKIYNIDLNKRTIEAPKFLSVSKDHNAETIYFKIDRFFDNVDLSNTVCLIQYKNALKEERVYVVPFYDIETFGRYIEGYKPVFLTVETYAPNKYYINLNEGQNKPGEYVLDSSEKFNPATFYYEKTYESKMLFPWRIQGEATKAAGMVEYSMRFYRMNENKEIFYNLNILPATSEVLYGMEIQKEEYPEKSEGATMLEQIAQRLLDLENRERREGISWEIL